MTFGMDYGQVVAHEDCPRCQAPAVVRSRRYGAEESSRLFENTLTCPKCHFVDFVEMVTFERMLDQKRLNRFKRLREKARTPREQRRLDQRIAEVERQMSLHDVIKWPERRKKIESVPTIPYPPEAFYYADVDKETAYQEAQDAQEDSGRSES